MVQQGNIACYRRKSSGVGVTDKALAISIKNALSALPGNCFSPDLESGVQSPDIDGNVISTGTTPGRTLPSDKFAELQYVSGPEHFGHITTDLIKTI